MVTEGGLPVQWACAVVGLGQTAHYRPLVEWARRDARVIAALTTLVAAKSRWGFAKCMNRLRLDGHRWNHKRLWRVYCCLQLNLPRRTKKRPPVRLRQALAMPPQPNVVWTVDFMSARLYGRRRFRTLNFPDEGVRGGLAIEVGTSLPAERVVQVLGQVVARRGELQATRLDNGLELIAERFMTWCAEQAIELRDIKPGQPDQNAFIGRFNRTHRTEVLDAYMFEHWTKCWRSLRNGYRATTKSGQMRRWQDYRPPGFGLNLKPGVLLLQCLLDGDFYAETRIPHYISN